jgi:hypothetical protein
MVTLTPVLEDLLGSLPPPPVGQPTLQDAASKAIEDGNLKVKSTENRRNQWEYLLKQEILELAVCVLTWSLQCLFIQALLVRKQKERH